MRFSVKMVIVSVKCLGARWRIVSNIAKNSNDIMKQIFLLCAIMLLTCCSKENTAMAQDKIDGGKTLVVYFTSSGNSKQIAEAVKAQMSSVDVIRIETVRETTNDEYVANNYALGNELLQKINNDPESSDSYPAIKSVDKDCSDYDNIIFVTPLWHAQMAAPAQSYLFQNRSKLAGKHFGMIVSSWSSGISTVVSNARRLVPDVVWMGESLWINHSNHSNRASLIQDWLPTLNYAKQTTMDKLYITIDGGQTLTATLSDNSSVQALIEALKQAPITYEAHDYGNFEKVGPLGQSFPENNENITTEPGDIILYQGSNLCLYYDTNTWTFTRIGKIEGKTKDELKQILKAGQGNITVTLSLSNTTAINNVHSNKERGINYSLNGQKVDNPLKGIYIKNGKKVIL